MLAYTLIHGCDPDKYKPGEIVEILPPDPKASPEWRMAVNTLRMEICKKRLDGDLSHAAENHLAEGIQVPNCKVLVANLKRWIKSHGRHPREDAKKDELRKLIFG